MNDIPRTMRAVVLTAHGGLDKLVFRDDCPTPSPGPGEVLIAVGACGLNNTDVNTRTAWYSRHAEEGTQDVQGGWGGAITFPRIQGADVCGRVAALGAGAPEALLGRRVLVDTWLRDWDRPMDMERCGYFGAERDGGFAEYTVVDARNVHPIESDLTDAELATFATSWITAEAMLERAGVAAGDVVLITGASGGVGTALVQLAARRGAKTVALCGDSKAAAVRALGADVVLPRFPENLAEALRAAIGRDDVDIVADVVGGPLWPQLIGALRRGGRYTCSGAIAGPKVDFDLRTFYLKDLTFTGVTIAPPDTFPRLVGYIERGEVRPVLAAVYPLRKLVRAQEAFLAKEHVGNIVVSVADG